MGRRLKSSDIRNDLGLMLANCLQLADTMGLRLTAARLASSIDQYKLETGVSPLGSDEDLVMAVSPLDQDVVATTDRKSKRSARRINR